MKDARLALSLLLDSKTITPPPDDVWAQVDWDRFFKLARKNVILIRICDALKKRGIAPKNPFFSTVAESERERIRRTLPLIRRLGEMCAQAGIEFVFPKAFQHYPDMGHDVDLFVMDRSHRIDELIVEVLHGMPIPASLVNRISGKTGYEIPGNPTPVEVHHGLMGHIGEHMNFPKSAVARRVEASIDGVTTWIPAREDRLIIQAIQRIYGHFNIRLSDALHGIRLILDGGLSWDSIFGTAEKIGILDGLRCYLAYLNQIHGTVSPAPLFPPEIERIVDPRRWGTVRFNGSHYRFPILRVSGRAFLKKFRADLNAGNWRSCGKICLIPPVTAWLAVRHAARAGKRMVMKG